MPRRHRRSAQGGVARKVAAAVVATWCAVALLGAQGIGELEVAALVAIIAGAAASAALVRRRRSRPA